MQVRLIGLAEILFQLWTLPEIFWGVEFPGSLFKLTYFTLSKENYAQINLVARTLPYGSKRFVRKFLKFRCCHNVFETSMFTENF